MNNTILAKNRRMKRKPRQEAGFTLLEILVAVVILSLGLLGLAGLQVSSLNNNQTAYYRSIASQQAYDMADRIRANIAGVRNGDYDDLDAVNPTDPDCFTAGCSTTTAMANTDYFQWRAINAELLPNGAGTVRCAEGPATGNCETEGLIRAYDITVTWTEKGATENITQSFVTRFSP